MTFKRINDEKADGCENEMVSGASGLDVTFYEG